MAIKILMPALSPTMVKGNLAKWLKNEGDIVKAGDVIAEIETDKATMEVESADSGVLGKIMIPAKSEGIKVGSIIAILLEKGEDASHIANIIKGYAQDDASSSPAVEPIEEGLKQNIKQVAESTLPTTTMLPTHQQTRIFASPLAKRMAHLRGVDLNRIKGTGPRGRIVKNDILNFKGNDASLNKGRNSEEYSVINLSQMRKTIAERLQESKSTIPHFYLSIDCDATEIIKLKNHLNASSESDVKVSINDIIVKVAAAALAKVPEANSGWVNGGIVQYNNIDISIAIALASDGNSGGGGLITPIVQNADQKSFVEISQEIKALATKAKNYQLKPHEFAGGSFTISNLGMYGIKEFKAIINPPQSCILAVGAAEERPAVKNGVIQAVSIMSVSISCDHRVVDGAIAAKFMHEFKKYIEQPINLFL